MNKDVAAAWEPVLTGDGAAHALGLARELGVLVRDAEPADNPSLATGAAGRAVALGYLDEAFPGEGFGEAAMDALRAAARGVATERVDASLMMGFTGVAWATAHLATRAGASSEGVTAAADEALIGVLERKSWRAGFELVGGICGVGVYALERLPSQAGRRLLELVVEELRRLSEPGEPGLTWLAQPEHLHPTTRARAPSGYYDLGLAHGVPGPVGVLAGGLAAGVPGCAEMLDGAVEWLEAQVLPETEVSLLPYGIGKGSEPGSARLAWCYGDPGAAAALLLAARAGHAPAAALARRAIERIAERSDESAGVQGASLCHGTAGLAHMCGRLGALAGAETLAPVARRWVAATHALRRPGAGPGGYSALEPGDIGAVAGDVQGIGLVGGIAGVALALAAAASSTDPAWDRALLVSLPPVTEP